MNCGIGPPPRPHEMLADTGSSSMQAPAKNVERLRLQWARLELARFEHSYAPGVAPRDRKSMRRTGARAGSSDGDRASILHSFRCGNRWRFSAPYRAEWTCQGIAFLSPP